MIKILKKIKIAIKEKNLLHKIYKKIYPYYKGFFLCLFLKKNKVSIIAPKKNVFDEDDLNLTRKIFESYKIMKKEQSTVDRLYRPSSLWQKHIDLDFKLLKEALDTNDLKKFTFFLQNFGNWENYLGIENQTLIKKYSKNFFLKKFLANEIFYGQKKLWEYFNQNTSSLSEVHMPRHGNQNGAIVDNNFFVIGSFSNHIYAKIIKKYLDNNKRNIIFDLGGGYGKLAYYILKDLKNYCFIDFDIPEVLCLATFYLSKCFPKKKIFLYGQENFGSNTLKNYDLVFLPGWEITKIADNEIDFAINKNSLGEMNSETSLNYLKHIHRTSNYFFSMNHEFFRNKFSDDSFSLINKEFNLNNNFKELFRYPDLSHLIYENNKIDMNSDIFFYIYKKNK